MKKILFIAAICTIASSVFAQKRETRQVDSFNYISMGVHADLTITQGSINEVILEGDAETLKNIETYVTGSKLKIRQENNSWFKNQRKIKIYITLKNFTGISLSGSGEAVSKGLLKGDNVDLHVSGSGDIDLNLRATDLDLGISGSGSINLQGKGKTASLSISGSGKLYAADYTLETISIKISGSGGAEINATKEIDSRISGSGTVRYVGEPDKLSNHSSGSGRLRKM
jgi:Putative auto-transporter adhesin, head GIN domain